MEQDATNPPVKKSILSSLSYKSLYITLGILFISAAGLTCAIIGVSLSDNQSQSSDSNNNQTITDTNGLDSDNNQKQKQTADNTKPTQANDDTADCSHSTVDLQALTGENNPNVYNSTTFYRTDSRYLCVEDWGIAIKLPDSVYSVIYTPAYDGSDMRNFHRMSIEAIIDENDNVNWGGNYMPDSSFSSITGIERVDHDTMDILSKSYNSNSFNKILETDDYIYFTQAIDGKTYADYYRELIKRINPSDYDNAYIIEAPEGFYDDVMTIVDLANDKDNYIIYDKSKA